MTEQHPAATVEVPSARVLPRRRFFNDMPDKGMFAVAALLGFMGIYLLKVYTHIPAEIVASAAVAVMLAYGFAAFQMPAVQMRPDRLGDNFYYLGFIYTLASLCAALMQINRGAGIDTLLANFGIALITTVVGVSGRVLFVQMRGELDEAEEQARRDLLHVASDLRAQLTLSLREFETFHVSVVQASTEAINRSTSQAEAQIAKIAEVAEAAVDKINASFRASQSQSDQLHEMLSKTTRAVGELPMLKEVSLPSERLERQIAGFTSQIDAFVGQLQAAVLESQQARRKRRRCVALPLKLCIFTLVVLGVGYVPLFSPGRREPTRFGAWPDFG